MATPWILYSLSLISLWQSIRMEVVPPPPPQTCLRSGDRFVKDYIQYECFSKDLNLVTLDDPLSERLNLDRFNLVGRPIGCVPTNKTSGPVIVPGATHTTLHFRYECIRDSSNAVTLRISHCVDNTGALVKIGDFFTQQTSSGEHESVECAGDEFLAKKIVHKWTKCTLPNGRKLVEGNFVTEDVPKSELKSSLQSAEIISCVRDGPDVELKCTGCVTSTGVHVGVTGYENVTDQWTQCRRYKDGCRLINVTRDYIDCQFEGKTIANGNYFTSKSGISTFYCNHGAVIKKGCNVDGGFVLLGDVKYVNDRPVLCEQSDRLVTFNGLIGCDLPDGRFKRFLATWRDNNVMKRCSWLSSNEGIAQSRITSYACIDGNDQVPLNKIIQRPDGEFFKCVASHSNEDGLEIRSLTNEETRDYVRKKTAKLDLIEYFGVGGRSATVETYYARPPGYGEEECKDFLPFCDRVVNYCSFMKGFESGLALESYSEFREVQSRFSKLASSPLDGNSPSGCENQWTSFQKLQVLVELSCVRTCKRCSNNNDDARLISRLEQSANCGK